MIPIIISSLLFVLIIYLGIGYTVGRKATGIDDLLPMGRHKQARVKNSAEFSASTVATTISFATVIMAFFELAGYFGIWLLWTVVTTAGGLIFVRFFAGKIWDKMNSYERKPTLHEFLGNLYKSTALSHVGAVCTSLGFLGAFAAELTVGSRFFHGLIPGIAPWVIVLVLSTVAFLYTAMGGFRAVIVTDRVQMFSIWLLLFSLPAFYVYYIYTHGGLAESFANIPAGTLTFSTKGRVGLLPFMLGIFVINVPTYLSDMSVWQRIAGAQHRITVTRGLFRGVFAATVTWSALVMLACLVFMIVTPQQDENPLIALLKIISETSGIIAPVVMFITVLGLYGAMLSTASTQLIAVSQTLYVDVFSKFVKHVPDSKDRSRKELIISRWILVIAAVVSTILVQILSIAGFTIADLVFAIYGSQLGLCPLVLMALLGDRKKLKKLSTFAVIALSAGFIAGWGSAIYAKIIGNDTLIFLAPVFSLAASSFFLAVGVAVSSIKQKEHINWILIKSIWRARRKGLYKIVPADKPMRLDCLMDKCAICCKSIGTPVITPEEAERIGGDTVMQADGAMFIRSSDCSCPFLKDGLCSIHTIRPNSCKEYPWYNIDGKLYYDKGCPGVIYDKDERPAVTDIEPFERFFPKPQGLTVTLTKAICVKRH